MADRADEVRSLIVVDQSERLEARDWLLWDRPLLNRLSDQLLLNFYTYFMLFTRSLIL